jgi:hypothetical protein
LSGLAGNLRFVSTPVDPSWLPSTVAQSTAALVGIVGGLLVARFMSIDVEQRTLRNRLAEARERLTFVQGVRDRLGDELLQTRALSALTGWRSITLLIALRDKPNLPPQMVLDSIDHDGLDTAEIAPWLVTARGVVSETWSTPDALLPESESEPVKWSVTRRKAGLPDDEWDDLRAGVFEAVVDAKTSAAKKKRVALEEEERRKEAAAAAAQRPVIAAALRAGLLSVTGGTSLPGPAALFTPDRVMPPAAGPSSTAKLRDRIAQADDDGRRAQFEYDLADQAVKEHFLPSELTRAVWVLTGLTVVGLVWPVVALYLMPSYGNGAARFWVLTAFVVGIGTLLAYLWHTARRLKRG